MKLFTCDNCGFESSQPLDEEKHLDNHGVWHTYDLCAPCRKKLKEKFKKTTDEFIKAMKKK